MKLSQNRSFKLSVILLLSLLTLATLGCKPKKDVSVDNVSALENSRWELTELLGKPLSEYGETDEVPFLRFSDSGVVSGSLSCNLLNGNFELVSENTIRFSKMAATKKMCANITVEDEFLKVLNSIDHFHIEGDELHLSVGEAEPTAKLERK